MYLVYVSRCFSTLCFFLGLLIAQLFPRVGAATELALSFFDVGQGDAALIVSPTGKRILVDGGPPEGAEALMQGLLQRHVDRLDLVVLSHPHLDHLGGLRKVLERLPVALYMDAGYPNTSPAYTALLKTLEAHGVPVKQAVGGRTIDIGGGATLRLLGPPSPWLTRTRSDVNANSVLVKLVWQERTALFCGDAEPETERWLLEQYRGDPGLLRAEVLKVPHHGGRYSSTPAFVAAVQPRWAVISVATVNDYGHPTPEAMGRLRQTGAQLLRTDMDGKGGAVVLRSRDGGPWQIEALAFAGAPPASPAAVRVAAPTGYVGSSLSKVFHREDCPSARKISLANLLRWKSREEALATGRRPAEDCHP